MKDALLIVAVAGIGYLVWKDYKRGQKKCGCSGSSSSTTAATSTTPAAATSQPVATSVQASPALSANGDGFDKKKFI